MKFGLVRCLIFAFACIIGTCGVSVWAEDTVTCEAGKYLENAECKECPLAGTNADGKVGDRKRYRFIEGDDKSKCYIKLMAEYGISNCGYDTKVMYVYDAEQNAYVYDKVNSKIIPRDNSYEIGWIGDTDVEDRCGDCPFHEGYYYTEESVDGIMNKKVCKKCPLADTNAEDEVGEVGDKKPYRFMEGDDRSKCYIKLMAEDGISNCDSGTEVMYVYDNNEGAYVYDSDSSKIIPRDGFYEISGIGDTEVKDRCGDCDVGEGYYYTEELVDGDRYKNVCRKCPDPFDEENRTIVVGEGERFQFFRYGVVNKCAIKLDPSKDNCSISSKVVYVYDDTRDAYIRTGDSVVVPTEKSVVKPFPADDVIPSSFCEQCPSNAPYNVKGECAVCESGYWYWQEKNECRLCTSGFYCPDGVEIEECGPNTYSESGATECTSCAPPYSTVSSGPVNAGYDGLCLKRKKYNGQRQLVECSKGDTNCFGVGCASPDACKLPKSKLKLGDKSFSLGKNIKIEALNKSVISAVDSASQ